MGPMIDDDAVEPVVRMLLGATNVDGGITDEQKAVLRALVVGAWGRDDLDLDALEPLDPAAAASAIPADAQRRARELMVLLELCRHPISQAQVDRVDEYATTLGLGEAMGADIPRDLVRKGAAEAMADYMRYVDDVRPDLEEPTMRDAHLDEGDAPDPELAARLKAMHDLPEGSLGWEYVEFYRRNGLTLPGDDPNSPALFVGHDMCHVIGGYEPTGQGEIALGAMQLSVTDSDAHWIGFLGNLAVHEAGYLTNESVTGVQATMTRTHAPELVAHAMWRGAQCTGDFTTADHLSMIELPLTDVRERYGVPPVDPAHPEAMHVRE
jgi:hypothetical protein